MTFGPPHRISLLGLLLLSLLTSCSPVTRANECRRLADAMEPLQALKADKISTAHELDAFATSVERTASALRTVECTNEDLKGWRDGVAQKLGKLAREAQKMKSAREENSKKGYRQARTRLLRISAKLKETGTSFGNLCR